MNRCRFKCTTDPFEIKALTVPASLLCTLSLRPSLESKGTVASTFIRADHDAVCLADFDPQMSDGTGKDEIDRLLRSCDVLCACVSRVGCMYD